MKQFLSILFSLFVILFGLFAAINIQVDFTSETFGISNVEEYRDYTELQEKFFKKEQIIIFGFKSNSKIVEIKEFTHFDTFTEQLKATGLFKEVHFITTIDFPRKVGPIISVSKFLPIDRQSTFDKKIKRIWEYPDITEKFISKDQHSVCVYAFMKSKELSSNGIKELQKLIQNVDGYESYVIGNSFSRPSIENNMKVDVIQTTLISFLVIVILFLILFGSIKSMVFLAWELLFCVTAFYALIYLAGVKLNLLSVSIPVIITTLSLSDTIHILSIAKGSSYEEKKMRFVEIKTPLLLTTLTTIGGFLIFVITGNWIIIEFALLAAIGLTISFLIARYWSPTIFFLLPNEQQPKNIRWDQITAHLLSWIKPFSKPIITVSIIIGIMSVWVASQSLTIDSFISDNYNSKLEPGRSLQFYQSNFSNPRQVELFISGDDLLSEKTIQTVDSIERYLINNYGANSTESINTSLRRLNRFLRNGDPAQFVIPEQITNNILHYLIKYRDNIGLNGVLTKDLKTLRIVINTPDFGVKTTLDKNEKLADFISEILPADQDFFIGGPTTINDKSTQRISTLILWGIFAGLAIVFVFLWGLYNSFLIAVFGGLVNLIPLLMVIFYYSLMDTNTGPNELMVISILLGIAVDDSIHLLSRYRASKNLNKTFEAIAQPIISTSLLLIGGFSALLFSAVPDNNVNGLAFIIGVFSALVCDLFLLPALINISYDSSSYQSN